MDDQQAGTAFRAIRIRKRWRQDDLATKAHVSRTIVGRIEHGRLGTIPIGMIRRVAAALDARFDTVVRWQGGDLGRLINARHAEMHEAMAIFMAGLDGWVAEPEVSFSIYGERGVLDVLAWHPRAADPPHHRAEDRARRHQRSDGCGRSQAAPGYDGGSRPRVGPPRDRYVGRRRRESDQPTGRCNPRIRPAREVPDGRTRDAALASQASGPSGRAGVLAIRPRHAHKTRSCTCSAGDTAQAIRSSSSTQIPDAPIHPLTRAQRRQSRRNAHQLDG